LTSFKSELVLRALASKRIIIENPIFPEEPDREVGKWSWAN